MRARTTAALLVAFLPGIAAAAPSCHSISASGLAFGTYDPFSGVPLDSAGTLSYSCPPPAYPQVTASAGWGSYALRTMRGPGAEALGYNLYLDAARTQVWGDGTGGSSVMSPGAGNVMTAPFYGRVSPGQNVAAGSYGDTIIVTFNF